jgi:hypothetical protein
MSFSDIPKRGSMMIPCLCRAAKDWVSEIQIDFKQGALSVTAQRLLLKLSVLETNNRKAANSFTDSIKRTLRSVAMSLHISLSPAQSQCSLQSIRD